VVDAQRRIAGALATGDCDAINALAPLEQATTLVKANQCRSMKNLTNLEVGGSASYGALGGVIDYKTTDGVVTAVLIRDADGLFHVAFLNPFNRKPSVGTRLASGFASTAAGAVRTLRGNDCEAFLGFSLRRFGDGGLPEPDACNVVRTSRFSTALRESKKARPIPSGGNADYAFYGMPTRAGFFTLVEAKESDSVPPSVAPEAVPLPPGAPRYGLVHAYLTNPHPSG
jgi:hypothetical protein